MDGNERGFDSGRYGSRSCGDCAGRFERRQTGVIFQYVYDNRCGCDNSMCIVPGFYTLVYVFKEKLGGKEIFENKLNYSGRTSEKRTTIK